VAISQNTFWSSVGQGIGCLLGAIAICLLIWAFAGFPVIK